MGPPHWRSDSIPSAQHIEYQSRQNSVRSDFVQFHSNKSAVRLTTRQSLFPLALVTVLFFVWGFAYGLLDVLNKKIQGLANLSEGQTTALLSAYWAGYFFAPITFAGYLLRRFGFRYTFIVGLVIYGTGCLIFWPCAVLNSYAGYVISNFIVGLGVATIEVAANLFIAITGPPMHWEARLNISQGIQAIGGVFAPILASRVLFRNLGQAGAATLVDVQWVYLAIAFFDYALGLVFWYSPLPECTNEELDGVNLWNPAGMSKPLHGSVFSRNRTLIWGVFAQFCYVGMQEVVSVYSGNWLVYGLGNPITTTHFLWTAEGLFAFGRLLAGLGMFYIPPRYIYLFYAIGITTTSTLLLALPYPPANKSYVNALLAIRALVQFFESTLFPTIFAISLRGLSGDAVKWGAGWMVFGTSGGGVWPSVYGAIIDRYGGINKTGNPGYRYGWALPMTGFAVGVFSHAVALNITPHWRRMLDALTIRGKRKRAERDGWIGKVEDERGQSSASGSEHREMDSNGGLVGGRRILT